MRTQVIFVILATVAIMTSCKKTDQFAQCNQKCDESEYLLQIACLGKCECVHVKKLDKAECEYLANHELTRNKWEEAEYRWNKRQECKTHLNHTEIIMCDGNLDQDYCGCLKIKQQMCRRRLSRAEANSCKENVGICECAQASCHGRLTHPQLLYCDGKLPFCECLDRHQECKQRLTPEQAAKCSDDAWCGCEYDIEWGICKASLSPGQVAFCISPKTPWNTADTCQCLELEKTCKKLMKDAGVGELEGCNDFNEGYCLCIQRKIASSEAVRQVIEENPVYEGSSPKTHMLAYFTEELDKYNAKTGNTVWLKPNNEGTK